MYRADNLGSNQPNLKLSSLPRSFAIQFDMRNSVGTYSCGLPSPYFPTRAYPVIASQNECICIEKFDVTIFIRPRVRPRGTWT